VRGRETLLARLGEAFDAAQNHILIKTTDKLAALLVEPILAAARRDVEIKIVASGNDWSQFEGVDNLALIPHEGTWSTPSRPHEMLLTTTIDSEALILGTFGPSPYGYVAPTSGLVYVVQTMILHEIYLAEIYRAIGPEFLEKKGVSFAALRERYRPASIGQRLMDEAKIGLEGGHPETFGGKGSTLNNE